VRSGKVKAITQEPDSITVGTRGSNLARTQTETVVSAIRSHFPDLKVTTRVISTEGDRVRDVSISSLGDKGVFVRNIERALLSGEIDLAVHSLKDVPSDDDVPGLKLAAFSPREDARDVLISRGGSALHSLPPGAVVGTSSLRRRSQLAACRSDLRVKDIRGNVDTRLRKLQDGEYDALILAAAGLLRLDRAETITEFLPVHLFTPDAGQGILAVQTRSDAWMDEVTDPLDDPAARLAAGAERACVRALGADCRSPVGAYATVDGDELLIVGMAARADGSQLHRDQVRGPVSESVQLGQELGSRLLMGFTSGSTQ
jgi:hydroxymethylbilane synthase